MPPEGETVAVPVQVQDAFVELIVADNGTKGVQLLFIDAIHAAFAALFATPGVSFPATVVNDQLPWSDGFVFTELLFHATFPAALPAK